MSDTTLSVKERRSRIAVLIIFILLLGLAFGAFAGYFFSLEPIYRVGRGDIPFGTAEYKAALSEAKVLQLQIIRAYISIGQMVSAVIALAAIFSWDNLYANRKLMSTLYRTVTVLVFSALGIAITFLAHYLAYNLIFESMEWSFYWEIRVRLYNIIGIVGAIILALCIALGVYTGYFLVHRFLYSPIDAKKKPKQGKN